MPEGSLRERLDRTISKIPQGPMGRIGGGNVLGAANYFVSSTARGFVPMDGLKAGYQIQSQNVEQEGDGERHTFKIRASNKHVAEFAARYLAAPSNVDYIVNRPEVASSEMETERKTLATYRIVVLTEEPEEDRDEREADNSVV